MLNFLDALLQIIIRTKLIFFSHAKLFRLDTGLLSDFFCNPTLLKFYSMYCADWC